MTTKVSNNHNAAADKVAAETTKLAGKTVDNDAEFAAEVWRAGIWVPAAGYYWDSTAYQAQCCVLGKVTAYCVHCSTAGTQYCTQYCAVGTELRTGHSIVLDTGHSDEHYVQYWALHTVLHSTTYWA